MLLAVLWRLRHKLSFRDVAELLLERGNEVTHETIRVSEFRFAPLLTELLRGKHRGRAGVSWYLDETYVRVAGRWRYLYRAIDRDGQLIDSMLSEHRDNHAARRFLRRLIDVAGAKPLRVTTDHHPAYRKAIRWILGRKVLHRTNQYLNNLTEQDHRAIKQRYYPMLGFGNFESAKRFCTAFEELRKYFRVGHRRGNHVALGEQRRGHDGPVNACRVSPFEHSAHDLRRMVAEPGIDSAGLGHRHHVLDEWSDLDQAACHQMT